jgi:hypothetical protein
MDEPRRETLLRANDEPRQRKSKIETAEPLLPNPRSDKEDPNREILLMDIELPKCEKSQIDRLTLLWKVENTDMEDPSRAKDRTERDEPI